MAQTCAWCVWTGSSVGLCRFSDNPVSMRHLSKGVWNRRLDCRPLSWVLEAQRLEHSCKFACKKSFRWKLLEEKEYFSFSNRTWETQQYPRFWRCARLLQWQVVVKKCEQQTSCKLCLNIRLPSTASIEIQLTFKKLITMSKNFLSDEQTQPSSCFCQDCIAELVKNLSFFVLWPLSETFGICRRFLLPSNFSF